MTNCQFSEAVRLAMLDLPLQPDGRQVRVPVSHDLLYTNILCCILCNVYLFTFLPVYRYPYVPIYLYIQCIVCTVYYIIMIYLHTVDDTVYTVYTTIDYVLHITCLR